MDKRDHLGKRGEYLALARLTEVCQANDLPYFLPHFLGEKTPLFDALVELIGAGEKTPYFFAQIKSTRSGCNARGRLKVKVSKDDVEAMAKFPAPTYVIGIDEKQEFAYIVAVCEGMTKGITSLNTAHKLGCATLKALWDEVVEYWKDKKMEQKTSKLLN